jgi:hypothetical protein
MFIAVAVLASVSYAPPPSQKINILISPIDKTVLLAEKNKNIVSHIDEEELISFKVVTNISDVFVTTSSLPQGSTFIDGVFKWTPNKDQSGAYEVLFSAKYRNSKDRQKVIIYVFDNILDIKVGQTYNKVLNVYDPDGDSVRIMLVSPPVGLTVQNNGPGSGLISWTPISSQKGVHEFMVVAIDLPQVDGGLVHVIQKQDVRNMRITVK